MACGGGCAALQRVRCRTTVWHGVVRRGVVRRAHRTQAPTHKLRTARRRTDRAQRAGLGVRIAPKRWPCASRAPNTAGVPCDGSATTGNMCKKKRSPRSPPAQRRRTPGARRTKGLGTPGSRRGGHASTTDEHCDNKERDVGVASGQASAGTTSQAPPRRWHRTADHQNAEWWLHVAASSTPATLVGHQALQPHPPTQHHLPPTSTAGVKSMAEVVVR